MDLVTRVWAEKLKINGKRRETPRDGPRYTPVFGPQGQEYLGYERDGIPYTPIIGGPDIIDLRDFIIG